jgi:hypothetical protein
MLLPAARFDGFPQAQQDGLVCTLCHGPITAAHYHVIDAEHCQVLCTCLFCRKLFRSANGATGRRGPKERGDWRPSWPGMPGP